MEPVLLIFYGLILVAHLIALCKALRNGNGWTRLLIGEFCSAGGAVAMAFFFDGLRGSGFMPGMSYIMEFFYSLAAAVVYIFMGLVSIAAMAIRRLISK